MKTSEMVFQWLKQQGFCPQIDQDGDIQFKYQMRNFYYFNNDDDESFFRLAMPGIFDVTDENRYAVLETMNEINKMFKIMKAFIPNNDVWLSTEILLDSTPEVGDLIPRLLNSLLHGQQDFYELIEK